VSLEQEDILIKENIDLLFSPKDQGGLDNLMNIRLKTKIDWTIKFISYFEMNSLLTGRSNYFNP
jgi:hypothetical protein